MIVQWRWSGDGARAAWMRSKLICSWREGGARGKVGEEKSILDFITRKDVDWRRGGRTGGGNDEAAISSYLKEDSLQYISTV